MFEALAELYNMFCSMKYSKICFSFVSEVVRSSWVLSGFRLCSLEGSGDAQVASKFEKEFLLSGFNSSEFSVALDYRFIGFYGVQIAFSQY